MRGPWIDREGEQVLAEWTCDAHTPETHPFHTNSNVRVPHKRILPGSRQEREELVPNPVFTLRCDFLVLRRLVCEGEEERADLRANWFFATIIAVHCHDSGKNVAVVNPQHAMGPESEHLCKR